MDEVIEMPVILPVASKDRAIQISGTIIGVDLFQFGFQYRPGQIYTTVTGGLFLREQLTNTEVMLGAEQNPQTETFIITNA